MSLTRTPLRVQIMRTVMVCLLLSITGASALINFLQIQQMQTSFISEMKTIGDIIGNRSIAALRFQDADAATANLQSARFNSSLTDLCLFDAERQLFSQYHLNPEVSCATALHTEQPQGRLNRRQFQLSLEILDQQEIMGYLTVSGRLDAIELQRWYMIAIILITSLLAGGVAYLLAQRMLKTTLAPMNHLTRVIARIAASPFSTLRARKHLNDEVGDVVDGVNHMLGILETENHRLIDSEEKFRTLSDNSPVGIYQKNNREQFIYTNQKWRDISNCEQPDKYHNYANNIHEDDIEHYNAAFEQVASTWQPAAIEYHYANADQRDPKTLMEHIAPLLHEHNGETSLIGFVGSVMDISDLKKAHKELEKLAFYDPLTELPNRRFFKDHLNFRLALATKKHSQLCVMMIDLDNFKRINDSMGHDAGDELIRITAARLREQLFNEDVVARMGGDEFIVLLDQTVSAASIESIAQRLLYSVTNPVEIHRQTVDVTCSIGLACYPDDALSAEDLIRHADIAMYKAKNSGKNQLAYFSSELNHELQEKLRLERKLRIALQQKCLEIYIQPQFDSLRGCFYWGEVLVRWQDPDEGFISPARFIPLAEETGLILEVGKFVFERTCQYLQEHGEAMAALGIAGLSINLSPQQFYSKTLISDIEALLETYDISPAQIELELTEHVVMEDIHAAIETMGALRRYGFHLSLDDFGTGYSSLSYIKRFDIDYIKIDKSFIDGLPGDKNDVAITSAIIAMSNRLGLTVIAEGIETEQQRDFLSMHGCQYMQGYLFARPMPIEQLLALTPPSPVTTTTE